MTKKRLTKLKNSLVSPNGSKLLLCRKEVMKNGTVSSNRIFSYCFICYCTMLSDSGNETIGKGLHRVNWPNGKGQSGLYEPSERTNRRNS